MEQSLKDKVAMVTGANGGIGRAVVDAFVECGMQVVGLDLTFGHTDKVEFLPIQCDVTDPVQVANAVNMCIKEFGRLDVAFNGAGISGRRFGDGPVHECTDEGWDTVISTNLSSVFYCCREETKVMLKQGSGCIINLSSVLGIVGGDEDFATHAYAASKAGIIGLTRAIAVTYAKYRISCNVICPGLVKTPMSIRAQRDLKILSRLPSLQPLTGGFGLPSDIASLAVYLAGPGSRFMTGAVIVIDGGWTAK